MIMAGQDSIDDLEVYDAESVQDEAPRLTSRNSQAAYDATRRDRKAKAADTIKANAEAAQKAKAKAQAKAPTVKGAAAFASKAKEIEKKIADAHAAKLKKAAK